MIEHKHIVIRAKVKKPPKNVDDTKIWFKNLIKHIGMNLLVGPVGTYLDKEGNRGLTMVAIIETSHIAMHVWDEQDPALVQLDVYTCGALNPDDVLDYLRKFEPVEVKYMMLDREHEIDIKELK